MLAQWIGAKNTAVFNHSGKNNLPWTIWTHIQQVFLGDSGLNRIMLVFGPCKTLSGARVFDSVFAGKHTFP